MNHGIKTPDSPGNSRTDCLGSPNRVPKFENSAEPCTKLLPLEAEQSLAFDVRQIAKKGLLRPGTFSWHWSNNYGEQVGSVGVGVADDARRVTLTYQWTPYNSDPRHIDCTLWIEQTPCNYGGTRPWFLCPSCGRRCAVVYFGAPGGRYACRHCARVAYLSQCDDEMGRLWRRQRKIERKLAGGADEWNGWHKPKGMHQQTFDRLRNQVWELETRRDEVFEVQAALLLRRLGVRVWKLGFGITTLLGVLNRA